MRRTPPTLAEIVDRVARERDFFRTTPRVNRTHVEGIPHVLANRAGRRVFVAVHELSDDEINPPRVVVPAVEMAVVA